MQPFRIAILGLGGVGGYLGGMLAAKYDQSSEVEVIFIARGSNLSVIRHTGLALTTEEEKWTVYPAQAISASEAQGEFDLLICCVKSYDLEESLVALREHIKDSTIILPFLNGVDAAERIIACLTCGIVLNGCCYIVARREAPGAIKVSGSLRQFVIGSSSSTADRTNHIAQLFMNAGIDIITAGNITETIWTKYLFISPFASLTSAKDLSLGRILENMDYKATLVELLTELKGLAEAKGIRLPAGIIGLLLDKLALIPYDATSSMHDDLRISNRSEVDTLTRYVVNEGEKLDYRTPGYRTVLSDIRQRWHTT